MNLFSLADKLRSSRGFVHKQDISDVAAAMGRLLGKSAAQDVPVGDDCAAIRDGDGYLLLAIEGFLNEFVEQDPWFAGYCAVMVNASDIYAMGGRPIAVVDALWSDGLTKAEPMLTGMAAAAQIYGIPIVGGHTNTRNASGQLAAAILGKADRLLSSFAALPGQMLIAAIDLRGRYREPNSYWDASTQRPAERLRGDLELLPLLAKSGLSAAAKDISMGGIIGTVLMLLECSSIGAEIDVNAIPTPPGVSMDRWLLSFPSYGFVLSAEQKNMERILEIFADREIAASAIGTTNDSGVLRLRDGESETEFWNLRERPLIGFSRPTAEVTL